MRAIPDRYLILPGLSITSRTEVRSIILQSRVPMEELDGKKVALTTASATSVVLLRILLELRYKVVLPIPLSSRGRTIPFGSVDAMLFIGDLALKTRPTAEYPYLFDLGALWHRFTGLPFVFALWQVNYKKSIDKDLAMLYDILMQIEAVRSFASPGPGRSACGPVRTSGRSCCPTTGNRSAMI